MLFFCLGGPIERIILPDPWSPIRTVYICCHFGLSASSVMKVVCSWLAMEICIAKNVPLPEQSVEKPTEAEDFTSLCCISHENGMLLTIYICIVRSEALIAVGIANQLRLCFINMTKFPLESGFFFKVPHCII